MSGRITKRQMKEDTFVSSMLRAWEYFRSHERAIFLALLGVVIVVALGAWGAYARRQSAERAAGKFSDAIMVFRSGDLKSAEELFRLVADEHGGTREGAYAQYFAGKCALETGRYGEAAEAFDRYLEKGGRHSFFHDAAMEGKAVAFSNERRYEDAAAAYAELAEHPKTNSFMKPVYLRRAADNLRLAGQPQRAAEVLGTLLETATGTERRDIEIEIEILKG